MCSPILPNEWRGPDIRDRFPGCLPERVPQPPPHGIPGRFPEQIPQPPFDEIPGCTPEQLPQPPHDEIRICFPQRTPTGTFPEATDCWPNEVLENPFESQIEQNREQWSSTISMPGPVGGSGGLFPEPRTCFGSAGLDIVA
jgi:hypothetical protein